MQTGFTGHVLESLLIDNGWTVILKAEGQRIVCILERDDKVFKSEGEDVLDAIRIAQNKWMMESE